MKGDVRVLREDYEKVSTMQRTGFVTALVGVLLTTTVAFIQAQADANRLTVPFSDPSRPGMVNVSLFNGAITVRASAGRDVIVITNGRRITNSREQPSGKGTGLRRLSQPVGLSVTEENNVMTIGSGRLTGGDVDIQVPAKTNLKLKTVNGDDILVERIEGDIEVTSLNGQITLTDVAGAVVAHATNGDVKVMLRQVTAQKPMSFTSFNGDVDVTLPPNTKANLKMRTDHGEVLTDFDVKVEQRPPRETLKPSLQPPQPPGRGGRRIELDSSIYGSVNGGGPEFELRTFNGDIYLRKGK